MLFHVSFRRLAPLALLTAAASSAFAAAPLSGTVTNRTTGKPSAGDDVVLIRLAQGMQESTRTKTDAKGHYTLDVPDEGMHLVRVLHDKVNYFQPVQPGTTSVDLDVYNVSPHVKGVVTEADVLRLQTDAAGTSLKIVENFFVKNDSQPAVTQFSDKPFDFYLPDGAVVEGSAALGPGSMPIKASPVPLADKGHYAFIFPIRPGETRFQVSYHLPYSGKLDIAPKLGTPIGTVALMMPKNMKFTPAPGGPFTSVEDEVNAQTYVAKDVTPKSDLAFTLTGTGQLPRDSQNPDQGSGAPPAAGAPGAPNADGTVPATQNTMPGKGLDNPLDPEGTRDPWSKYKLWILAGIALVIAAAAGILLSKPRTVPAGYVPPPPPSAQDQTLLALKEELFALETERLSGHIPEADYLAQKSAIETVLRRALGRNPAAPSVPADLDDENPVL